MGPSGMNISKTMTLTSWLLTWVGKIQSKTFRPAPDIRIIKLSQKAWSTLSIYNSVTLNKSYLSKGYVGL